MRPSSLPLPLPLLLATCVVLGCAGDSTAPPAPLLASQSVSTQAGWEGPNVVRFESWYFFGISDPETDLVAFAGLPDQSQTPNGCTGWGPPQQLDFQYVGLMQEAIKGLMKDSDVNVNVYRFSTFAGFCWSAPIATGKGRVTYVDNNVFGAPVTNGDAWGWLIEGPVTFVAGGTANLIAHNRWQALPNGTVQRVFRRVRLTAQ
ncbi:MAG: hypothetical protein ACJ79I_06675 [Gemmatimonadaceae bacterium]